MPEPLDTDVAIVGAGVVGCAIARELSQFDLRVTLLEAGTDVGAGTSKANTALLHTGFDAKPGTLEARLVARGYELLGEYAERVGIPVERTGALLVAWNEEQVAEFPAILEAARRNGSIDLREVGSRSCTGASRISGRARGARSRCRARALVCPFTTPLAFATEAVLPGCDLRRDTPVESVSRLGDGGFRLTLPGEELTARYLVNAAGLHSDELDRMAGPRRLHRHPAPRRADRVRQARAPAGRAHRAGRADQGHEGRSDRPDRVRQRDARADRRGRRATRTTPVRPGRGSTT